MTDGGHLAGPVRSEERLGILDAIRGLALGGILLANLASFFGHYFLSPDAREAMWAGSVGEAVLFGIDWFVEGKFYSIFSILLGVGFAIQWTRAQARGESSSDFARFFRRRMIVLVGFGLVHMYALWAGDILTLYGLMGLLLPILARGSSRARLALICTLLLIPFATHLVVYGSDGDIDPRPPFAEAGANAREALGGDGRSSLELFSGGGSADYMAWNIGYAVARPGTYLQGGRPAHVLGLFLIGAWLGVFLLPRLASLRRPLRTVAVAGAAVGLPASFAYAVIKARTESVFTLSYEGLAQTLLYAFGSTPLALSYMALAVLAWRTGLGRRTLEWFVPLGRMALTVYITQTVIQLLVFTGHGLSLGGVAPIALLPLAALGILATQRQACVWWLARYRQGPLEWLWRTLTYRQQSA
ncbi:MAG: DUF418 domain-containing protein [Gemmatimonadota bacterium]